MPDDRTYKAVFGDPLALDKKGRDGLVRRVEDVEEIIVPRTEWETLKKEVDDRAAIIEWARTAKELIRFVGIWASPILLVCGLIAAYVKFVIGAGP